MSTKLNYYIKERHNPQLAKPYYTGCGQLTKKEAKQKENSLYGFNVMLEYKTESEYLQALETLKKGKED